MSSQPKSATDRHSIVDPTSITEPKQDKIDLVIDHPLQIVMLRRFAAYAAVGIVYFAAISLTTASMSDPAFSWSSVWLKCCDEAIYWAPGLLFILPTLAVDLLRLTRRFAHPINQLSAELQLLADGKSESRLVLRGCESWQPMVNDYNRLRAEVLELRQFKMLAKGRPAAFASTVATEPRQTEPGTVETVEAKARELAVAGA